MRLRDVDDLPAVLTTAQLADLTGIGEETWWSVARGEGESSIEVTPIRVGRRGVLRWPTSPILAALGLATASAEPPARESESSAERESAPADQPGHRSTITRPGRVNGDATD